LQLLPKHRKRPSYYGDAANLQEPQSLDVTWDWTQKAVDTLLHRREAEDAGAGFLQLFYVLAASSIWSLLPVICPFGDPFDLSAAGYANNMGYFLAYNGVGWCSLYATFYCWTIRLLGLDVTRRGVLGAIILPTVLTMGIFFAMYVILGGPAPMGTLSIGLCLCVPLFFATLYVFVITPTKVSQYETDSHPDAALNATTTKKVEMSAATQKAVGLRCMAIYLAWGGWLVIMTFSTMLVIEFQDLSETFAVGFRALLPLFIDFDFKLFLFTGRISTRGRAGYISTIDGIKAGQWEAARMLPLLFIALHLTYFNFIFPVLTDTRTVIFGAITEVVVSALAVTNTFESVTLTVPLPYEGLSHVDDQIAESLYDRGLTQWCSIMTPILFAAILTFDHWGRPFHS